MQMTPWMTVMGALEEDARPGGGAWIAVLLVSMSTLAGAWLARRDSRRLVVWLAIASATMLITAVTDLLPDAWREAVETGVPVWAIGIATAAGFLVITYFTRKGCAHDHGPQTHQRGRHAPGRHRRLTEAVGAALFGGMGTAAALTTHRVIEGATLALSASVVVVVALMVHSASEGLALAALLDMARQRLAPWLVVSCVSPAIGVAFATLGRLPSRLVPVLLAMVTGVLLRTAIVGLKLAASRQESGRLSRRHVVVAAVTAITVGALLTVAHAGQGHDEHSGEAREATVAGSTDAGGGPAGPRGPVVQPGGKDQARAGGSATPSGPGPSRSRHPENGPGGVILAELASGRVTVGEVLERDDDAVGRLRVTQLLRSLPGDGAATVDALVTTGLIDDGLRLDGLSRRQHRKLLKAFTHCVQVAREPARGAPARGEPARSPGGARGPSCDRPAPPP